MKKPIESWAMRTEDIQPWDRQPGESPRMYEAFCIYRDLPSHARTVPAAFSFGRGSAKQVSLWYRWHKDNSWRDRAAAYDRHLDRIREEKWSTAITGIYDSTIADLANLRDKLSDIALGRSRAGMPQIKAIIYLLESMGFGKRLPPGVVSDTDTSSDAAAKILLYLPDNTRGSVEDE